MVRWRSERRSGNVEDRRGRSGVAVGGGLGVLVLALLVVLFGGDLEDVMRVIGQAPEASVREGPPPPGQEEEADFASAILASTEDAWSAIFTERGAEYRPPTLVLFTDVVRSGCGTAGAETGPFYCPADQKVYLDLGFFSELARMGGAGDFAGAYVIGHEVGHHVQTLSGTSEEVRRAQRGAAAAEANALSVRLELQADCYAGVWAARADRARGGHFLEDGDVEEGLAAAAAIGDDRMARQAGRAVSPESFTHGTSEQRAAWLRRGLESGEPESCDTLGQ
ncbi:MAG TPA: neutral zinc metallopeptidase [Gemmatimonadota bacterium]|nr:neutral zinc metallopeptidase [Gemmatimonadota bacterium]